MILAAPESKFMKEIQLTDGYIALVDDGDYARVSQFQWQATVRKRSDGSIRGVYGLRTVWDGKKVKAVYLHQFVMDSQWVDHKDHNGLNCQKGNLRIADRSKNGGNARKMQRQKPTTSKYKGVSWDKRENKWRVSLMYQGKKCWFGYYTEENVAALVYDVTARLLFGDFANVNFKQPDDTSGGQETK